MSLRSALRHLGGAVRGVLGRLASRVREWLGVATGAASNVGMALPAAGKALAVALGGEGATDGIGTAFSTVDRLTRVALGLAVSLVLLLGPVVLVLGWIAVLAAWVFSAVRASSASRAVRRPGVTAGPQPTMITGLLCSRYEVPGYFAGPNSRKGTPVGRTALGVRGFAGARRLGQHASRG